MKGDDDQWAVLRRPEEILRSTRATMDATNKLLKEARELLDQEKQEAKPESPDDSGNESGPS